MKAYEQLALLLADAGVTTVFGVMGDGNMHWIAAYREQRGCQWRPAWHEAGAVWMADGYAGATGDVGVATVTMGPGLAQSLAALSTAARVRRPVLLITAALRTRVPPEAQDSPQRALVAASGARYIAVQSASELPATLGTALEWARGGDVTVLAVDLDVFQEPAYVAAASVRGAGTRVARRVDALALSAAADALRTATAPMVVIGRGVLAADCLDAALQVGRRVGAVFATTLGGRTALPDEPFDLGVIGMMADPTARAIGGRADVVLVLGAALDRYNCDGGDFARDAHVIRVDIRPPGELWSPSERTTWLTGDVSDVVPALTALLPEAAGVRTLEVRSALAAERARQDALPALHSMDGANPWAMVAELNAMLPADAYVVVGIGHFWYFVAPYVRPGPRRRFHFACGFGLIGQALPVAVGAAAALGDRHTVVAIEGDGSVVMNVQELQAAVRHGVDLLLVVMNNQAYGSEYHKLALAHLDVAGSEFDAIPFDVVEVSEAMGATARRAGDPEQLREALRELLPVAGVRVIDAQISRSTLSEVYQRQHGGAPHH
jgi:thiamine pyrophosphate-dependent acetolactate synthase large subunit-like protein